MAMLAHHASAAVQESACQALKEMAAHDSGIQHAISASSGVEAVLSAMDLHASVAGVQAAGCGVMRNLTAGNGHLQDKVLSLGGARAVLRAMDTHPADDQVQWAGCWALFCLTWKRPAQRAEEAEEEVRAVLRAMGSHATAARVQEAGCWALNATAGADGSSLSLLPECVQAVSAAMKEHQSGEVLVAGKAALRRLIVRGAACKARASALQSCRRVQARQGVRRSIAKTRHLMAVRGLTVIAE